MDLLPEAVITAVFLSYFIHEDYVGDFLISLLVNYYDSSIYSQYKWKSIRFLCNPADKLTIDL